jgi:hypothetical protein
MVSDMSKRKNSFSSRRVNVLWDAWWQIIQSFRPACSRSTTFLWLAVVLAAFVLRPELLGVTSMVRGLGLGEAAYYSLLHFFNSSALKTGILTQCWLRTVLQCFKRWIVTVNGRPVVLVDALKNAKEGKKMPAVRLWHQESSNNSKPEYIMGHWLQGVSLLVKSAGLPVAVPISARIHGGVRWSNRDRRTLLNTLIQMIKDLPWGLLKVTVVADAYYAAAKLVEAFLKSGHHLVTRARSNAVAYQKAPVSRRKGPGRKPFYGRKIKLGKLFSARKKQFLSAPSPVYGEQDVKLTYFSQDWLWRPLGRVVRYVLVNHPLRGRMILICTDLTMPPLEIIRLYGWRFKIEVGFRHAIHVLGAYGYHFWMRTMEPIRWGSRDQHMHRRSPAYRERVRRKMAAYERFIQIGLISQGILIYLGMRFRHVCWRSLNTYRRTARTSRPPSEWTVIWIMRNSWHQFLRFSPKAEILEKFLLDRKALETEPYSRVYVPPSPLDLAA